MTGARLKRHTSESLRGEKKLPWGPDVVFIHEQRPII